MKRAQLVTLGLVLGAALGGLTVWTMLTRPAWLPWSGPAAEQASSKQARTKEKIVKYVGPMHPQIVRDQPGTCPICGMDLVPKEVGPGGAQQSTGIKQDESKGKILYWVAPMDPGYKRDEPGTSPMGMDLVPVYADDVADKPGTVTIDPRVVHNIGVRTDTVQRRDLSRRFRTVGEVTYNEREVSHIHTRVDGWVEALSLDAPGDRVEKGQPILEIYSPELVTAQEEYLLALRRLNRVKESQPQARQDARSLVRQTKDRLRFFGISEPEIKQIARTGRYQSTIVLRAPHSGVVTELGVRKGMRVTPETMLYTVADLSTVWVMAHVYASQAEWVASGDPVELNLPFYPDRTWTGQVEYIYPFMESNSRTIRARLVFDNPDGTLKPNMFATASIQASPLQEVLVVPQQAVIRTGKRSVVIASLGQGRFRPVEVRTGVESGGWIQIIKGLAEGQRVVTSAQFLIDAESSLQAGLQRMSGQDGHQKGPSKGKGTHSGHGNHTGRMDMENDKAPEKHIHEHGGNKGQTSRTMDNSDPADQPSQTDSGRHDHSRHGTKNGSFRSSAGGSQ